MSISDQEVTWDRRRQDRRGESTGTDRRRADSPLGRFEAFVDTQLEALEHSAALAAGQIAAEARKARGELANGDLDAEPIDGLAARLSRMTEDIAEELSRVRGELATAAAGDEPSDSEPSPGTEMIVRQMAVAGADADEIEAELANLGLQHPRHAIDMLLASAQPPQ
jgi:ubiquinone biosynthesis protein UbiJ